MPNVMRKPSFLGVPGSSEAASLRFDVIGAPRNAVRVEQVFPAPSAAPIEVHTTEEEEEDSLEEAREALALENARTLAATVERLEKEIIRLAREASSDAVQIGFLVAQKVLEMELATRPVALVNLVQAALRKAGEARELTVKLCPADLQRIQELGGVGAVKGLRIATLNLVADASLTTGDCLIESELGRVDARLATRLGNVQRAVLHETAEESG